MLKIIADAIMGNGDAGTSRCLARGLAQEIEDSLVSIVCFELRGEERGQELLAMSSPLFCSDWKS